MQWRALSVKICSPPWLSKIWPLPRESLVHTTQLTVVSKNSYQQVAGAFIPKLAQGIAELCKLEWMTYTRYSRDLPHLLVPKSRHCSTKTGLCLQMSWERNVRVICLAQATVLTHMQAKMFWIECLSRMILTNSCRIGMKRADYPPRITKAMTVQRAKLTWMQPSIAIKGQKSLKWQTKSSLVFKLVQSRLFQTLVRKLSQRLMRLKEYLLKNSR